MSGKLIKVTVYLRTDVLPGANEGEIVPGHAWASGVVRVRPSKAHRLRVGQPMPFSGMTQVGTAVEEALTAADVTLHLRPGPPGPPRPARPVRRVTSQPPGGFCLLGPPRAPSQREPVRSVILLAQNVK
jgi:hypothetical protein